MRACAERVLLRRRGWPGVRRGAPAPWPPVAGDRLACPSGMRGSPDCGALHILAFISSAHCNQACIRRVNVHAWVRAWASMGGCTAHVFISG
jgi:hypothetical protein